MQRKTTRRPEKAQRPGESIEVWYRRVYPLCGHDKPYNFVPYATMPGGASLHFEGVLNVLGMQGTSWDTCDKPPVEVVHSYAP